jgi:polyhydroxyalkanoate synthase
MLAHQGEGSTTKQPAIRREMAAAKEPKAMSQDSQDSTEPAEAFAALLGAQAEAAKTMFAAFLQAPASGMANTASLSEASEKIATLWQAMLTGQSDLSDAVNGADGWAALRQCWAGRLPEGALERQQALWSDLSAIWQEAIVNGAAMNGEEPFADNPLFALIQQAYARLSAETLALSSEVGDLEPARQAQLRFFTEALVDALNPENFPLTNPKVLARAQETGGESLVKGMEHLTADLQRGQLTHSDPAGFRLGETIAATPGKVVHETPLYQLIQYTPTTAKVLEMPLVIFPPWINRFYILDLNPAKSFVRWAVEQGITVFMVSWKSADETMAEVIWDDYIAAQIDAFDAVRARLNVPAVHAIGYCAAGTTLAATLAIMARRGDADKVASATFFTAQVDFEEAGDLKHFVDDAQLAMVDQLTPNGYLDGRVMAATFNLLRGRDLIWGPAIKYYLLGEDRPAFDMLYWNGDVTNLPAKWHKDYLRDLYRDNRLVVADSLSALGTPIDISRIATPSFIQAGREDHIAPPGSVWKITRYLSGPWEFVLAGSGHIAGVVNPPASGKYQYWTNPAERETLDGFIAGATEHKGSWWPHWAAWLRARAPAEVAAKGKRKPGGKGDPCVEDAPGRYVRER